MRITFSLLLFLGLLSCLAAQSPDQSVQPAGYEIYKVVEQMPQFYDENCPEGNSLEAKVCSQKAMLMFVYGNLRYPTEAKDQGVEGMAVISFVVDPEGWIYDPTIVRDPGAGTGEEALRIVEKMMDEVQWWPGLNNGEPAHVKFNIPIKFKITN